MVYRVIMKKLETTHDFRGIAVNDVPLIDVRAPVEFTAGAFPGAVNLPLLDDEDRHLVGLCYKRNGKEAAFDLAHNRVSGKVKEARVGAWLSFQKEHPNALLYCFRGGMRSKTAQQWLQQESGVIIARLQGGYKAYRRFLIDALDPEKISAVPVILGGRTGCGKTILLRRLENSIDLESIANHRGSAFGGYLSPQPTQIDFENSLAVSLLKHKHRGFRYVVLEDEGSYIGARYIPHKLAAYCKRDSMVLLQCDQDNRIDITWQEYVIDAQDHYRRVYGAEQGPAMWYQHIKSRLHRIRKRLGGERLLRVSRLLEDAQNLQLAHGNQIAHRQWIELLLLEYYDPMYDYQIEKSGRKILFQGEAEEVLDYLQNLEKQI
jgi:tRNA 2-selenouridine synthase